MACSDRYSVALCLHDMRGSATGRQRVGPFVYVRFHGADVALTVAATLTGGSASWATWLVAQRRAGADVYRVLQ